MSGTRAALLGLVAGAVVAFIADRLAGAGHGIRMAVILLAWLHSICRRPGKAFGIE